MFWTGRVMDALFNGIPVDCSDEENFEATAVCSIFKTGEVKAVQPINATHFSFSLFQAVRIIKSSSEIDKMLHNFIMFFKQ